MNGVCNYTPDYTELLTQVTWYTGKTGYKS